MEVQFGLINVNVCYMGTEIDLTDREAVHRAFVKEFRKHENATQAAIAAGYPENRAEAAGYALLRTAPVLAAIQADARRYLISDVGASIRTLQLLRDKATSEKVRADAARTLLDRAGLIAPRAVAENKGNDLSLHEMSLTDLRGLADKLEGELATRAKPVSSVNAAQLDTQPIDLA